MPDGASTLCLWCISTISMSKRSSRMPATWRVSANRMLTARLILGAITMGAPCAASPMARSCAASRPVVPMTCGVPASPAIAACRVVASGSENSIATRARSKTRAGSSPIGMPSAPTPAREPASSPIAGWPATSAAATSAQPSVSNISWTTAAPIRPAAPITPISSSAITPPERLVQRDHHSRSRAPPDRPACAARQVLRKLSSVTTLPASGPASFPSPPPPSGAAPAAPSGWGPKRRPKLTAGSMKAVTAS